MTKANSQTRKALAALRQGKQLTQRIAINLWAAYRLSSIITRLRAEGWNIKTKLVPNGNGSRHGVYSMGRPHTFKGRRVKAIKGDGSFFRKGAEGTIVSVAVDGDYLVKFDKGWYRRDHKQEGHRWASPAHFKFIKGVK